MRRIIPKKYKFYYTSEYFKKSTLTNKLNINKNIVQLQEEKFKCELCPKQFKGLQFAKNHIINRHADIMYEAIDKHVRLY